MEWVRAWEGGRNQTVSKKGNKLKKQRVIRGLSGIFSKRKGKKRAGGKGRSGIVFRAVVFLSVPFFKGMLALMALPYVALGVRAGAQHCTVPAGLELQGGGSWRPQRGFAGNIIIIIVVVLVVMCHITFYFSMYTSHMCTSSMHWILLTFVWGNINYNDTTAIMHKRIKPFYYIFVKTASIASSLWVGTYYSNSWVTMGCLVSFGGLYSTQKLVSLTC